MSNEVVKASKKLSYILRHAPESAGLTLDSAGWVSVDALLVATHFTREQVERAVSENDKKRFEFSEDGSRIRAVQGHSVEVDLEYAPSVPPPVLFHGTADRFLAAIMKEGLKPMGRQQVHLSADIMVASVVGKRHGKPVVLRVQTVAMREKGRQFYLAKNGVWLTDDVPAEFLSKVE